MASTASILLSASAQSQLTKLKEINKIPLNKLDAKKTAVTAQQTAVSTLQKDVTSLKESLTKLKTAATQTEQADAIKAFVQEFNDLNKNLTTFTGKDGKLQSTSEVRSTKMDLKSPLVSMDVQAALNAAGVTSTANGLEFSGALTSTVDFSALTTAFDSTTTSLDSKLNSANSRFSNQLTRISKERERVEDRVERADKRTELNYIRMYQAMQIMNPQAQSVSLFG